VITLVAKQNHATQNVNRAIEEKQTFSDRLADRVAGFGGSWTFITLFLAVLGARVLLNSAALLPGGGAFDPEPEA
jgi:uncharacterized membrane protein